MKKMLFALTLASVFASSAAFAGVSNTYNLVTSSTSSTTGNNSRTETSGYVGLNWTLGGSITPALVLGIFNTRVHSNGNTDGASLAFHLNLLGGIAPGKLKLSYLNGVNYLQGELGIGYDFMKSAPLLGFGANAPFVGAGVDAYLNGSLVPYATLHSQDRFKKPALQTTTSTNTTCTATNNLSGAFIDPSCQIPSNLN